MKETRLKVLVIADTHIPRRATALPEPIIRSAQEMDLIVHAGDFISVRVLDELNSINRVEAVHGNVDSFSLKRRLPARTVLILEGWRIGLVHGHYGKGVNTPERAWNSFEGERLDCIVFGHSHMPLNETRDGTILFNPGSPTDPRRAVRKSYGVLSLGDRLKGEIKYVAQS